jgi:hypothetical protein
MSDILIRGIELPKNEPLRLVLNPNGQLFVDHGVTFEEYEAVELPEHGRLIDADKLLHPDPSTESTPFAFTACKIIEAPTVIPSNKEAQDD